MGKKVQAIAYNFDRRILGEEFGRKPLFPADILGSRVILG